MASRRILTRLQLKKENPTARNDTNITVKRKSSGHAVNGCENENTTTKSAQSSLNKSFPPNAEASSGKFNKRKATDVDNSAKQRYALSDRGNNGQKCSNESKKECKIVAEEATVSENDCHKHSPCLYSTSLEEETIIETEINTICNSTTPVDTTCEECDETQDLSSMLDESNCYEPHSRLESTHSTLDSSMDTFSPLEKLEKTHIATSLDTINSICQIYEADILDSLLEKENEYPLPSKFLELSPQLTPRMRGVLMDWLIKVQAHEDLEEETLHLCVALIDRYLSTTPVELTSLQLLGITSMLVASKFYERFAPEISSLCYLTSNTFQRKDVIRYELKVLATLDFDLCIPVSTTFLRMYLQIHADEQPKEVTALAYYITDLSITSERLASALPSMMAASAVYLSRRLVMGVKQAWSRSLGRFTRYNPANDLGDTINELARILFRAPQSKYQGARDKFNTERYYFISHSKITSPEIVDTHFLAQVSSV